MADREKIIKRLIDALAENENYPLAKVEMSLDFIEMLLELLKEQEARVMTLEEVKKHNNFAQRIPVVEVQLEELTKRVEALEKRSLG